MKNMLRLCYAFKNQNQMITYKCSNPMFITSTLKTNTTIINMMHLKIKNYPLLCHHESNESNYNIYIFFIMHKKEITHTKRNSDSLLVTSTLKKIQ